MAHSDKDYGKNYTKYTGKNNGRKKFMHAHFRYTNIPFEDSSCMSNQIFLLVTLLLCFIKYCTHMNLSFLGLFQLLRNSPEI